MCSLCMTCSFPAYRGGDDERYYFLGRGQGFQNISKGNYAEKFSVRNVNALACSLCL